MIKINNILTLAYCVLSMSSFAAPYDNSELAFHEITSQPLYSALHQACCAIYPGTSLEVIQQLMHSALIYDNVSDLESIYEMFRTDDAAQDQQFKATLKDVIAHELELYEWKSQIRTPAQASLLLEHYKERIRTRMHLHDTSLHINRDMDADTAQEILIATLRNQFASTLIGGQCIFSMRDEQYLTQQPDQIMCVVNKILFTLRANMFLDNMLNIIQMIEKCLAQYISSCRPLDLGGLPLDYLDYLNRKYDIGSRKIVFYHKSSRGS